MALEALGIGEGDEVIVPAISFISTATAVSRVRATPVFVDIEPDTFNIDAGRIREAIGPKTRAVIPVHFGGPMADMDAITAVASAHGLPILEDAAHAHGSEWNGVRAGSIGTISSFSFQNGKVMTAGEGGILLSSDEALIDRAREILDQGRRKGEGWFFHYTLGTNYRTTAWQSAVSSRSWNGCRSKTSGARATLVLFAIVWPTWLVCTSSAYRRRTRPYELSAVGVGRWRSRRVPQETYGGGIPMHSLLSAYALSESALPPTHELPRNAVPQRRSAHQRRLLGSSPCVARRRGGFNGDGKCDAGRHLILRGDRRLAPSQAVQAASSGARRAAR